MISHTDPLLDGAWKCKTRLAAVEFGLTVTSEAFGKRGVSIDVWQGDVKLGYRKSWKAAYALVLTGAPKVATHPDKQAVRDLMAQHRAENTPPLSMDEIRRSLGWHLIEAERAATKPQ